MLEPITNELRKAGGVTNTALATLVEGQSVNTQELRHQSRELGTIKKQSKSNGESIGVLEDLQLSEVKKKVETIHAAYVLWARWKGPVKWVGGSLASLIVVALGAWIKHLVETL